MSFGNRQYLPLLIFIYACSVCATLEIITTDIYN